MSKAREEILIILSKDAMERACSLLEEAGIAFRTHDGPKHVDIVRYLDNMPDFSKLPGRHQDVDSLMCEKGHPFFLEFKKSLRGLLYGEWQITNLLIVSKKTDGVVFIVVGSAEAPKYYAKIMSGKIVDHLQRVDKEKFDEILNTARREAQRNSDSKLVSECQETTKELIKQAEELLKEINQSSQDEVQLEFHRWHQLLLDVDNKRGFIS